MQNKRTTGAHGHVCAFLLALIGVLAEIVIEKSSLHVWSKDSPSKKRAVDSDSRNSLTKIFYWQCLEIILIGCKLLG